MKKVRWIVCILFVLSCILFGVYVVRDNMTKDKTAPTITCDTDTLMVSVSATTEELLQGVTARDDQDGDLTADVRIASMSYLSGNERTIRYVVFDKANHAGMAERTLVYTDYTAPKIYTDHPLHYTAEAFSVQELLKHVTAKDCLDGDVTSLVRVQMDDCFYRGEACTGLVRLLVSNSGADTLSLELEMTLTDQGDGAEREKYYPMVSEYIVYTKVGKSVDPLAYLTGVEHNGYTYAFDEGTEITRDMIVMEEAVDVSQPGTYPVRFSYTTPAGVKAVTTMYVVVEE